MKHRFRSKKEGYPIHNKGVMQNELSICKKYGLVSKGTLYRFKAKLGKTLRLLRNNSEDHPSVKDKLTSLINYGVLREDCTDLAEIIDTINVSNYLQRTLLVILHKYFRGNLSYSFLRMILAHGYVKVKYRSGVTKRITHCSFLVSRATQIIINEVTLDNPEGQLSFDRFSRTKKKVENQKFDQSINLKQTTLDNTA